MTLFAHGFIISPVHSLELYTLEVDQKDLNVIQTDLDNEGQS